MSRSVVGKTIKKHNYFAAIYFEKVSILKCGGHFEFENIQNEFLGLINIEINASYETLCQIIGSYAL